VNPQSLAAADNGQELSPEIDAICSSGADEAFADLDLVDLNVILHRADGEERDATGELDH
jgi:glycogen debranching enzyme